MTGSAEVPRWARWFAGLYLAAFIACAVWGIEAWPFTGWKLFSRSRHELTLGYEARAVVPGGAERLVPFQRMRYAYWGYPQILEGFAALTAREQQRVCDAWADAAEPLIGPVSAIRIYRTERHLSDREGRRGVEPQRTLDGECVL